MDIGLVSLILLIIVVIVGFVRKVNVGVLAIAAAAILAYTTGAFTGKEVIKGFSASLFMTLFGVTFLFAIIQDNGCLQVLMKKVVRLFGKRVWLIPILMFIIGWVMSAIGPGCVPTLAFVAALAIPLSHETGYDPIMLMLIGDVATYSGRWSPISPEGILVSSLLGEQGITGVLSPMIINTGIGAIIFSIIVFVFYKGYKVKANTEVEQDEVENVGGNVNPIAIVSTIGMISSCAGFSPASTVGAVIMGAYEGDAAIKNKKPANKLFIELFAWSVFCVLFFALLSFLGVFSIIK